MAGYYKLEILSPRIEKPVRNYYDADKVTGTQKMEQQTQLKYVKTKKLQRVMLQLNLKKQGVCRQVEGVCAIRENHRKGMSGKPQVSIVPHSES